MIGLVWLLMFADGLLGCGDVGGFGVSCGIVCCLWIGGCYSLLIVLIRI